MFQKIGLASILFFLVFSCTGNDCEPAGLTEEVELKINAHILTPRSVTKYSFTPNDAIGIYPVNYTNDTPGILGDVQNPLNREYVFNGTEWQGATGQEIFLNETLTDVYAYYPYDPELNTMPDKLNVSSYPYSLPTDQSNSGPEIEFLWAKTEGLSLTNNRANIQFQRLFARIVLNLYSNNGVAEEISDVQIHNVYTSCRIDLRTGTTIPSGTTVPVQPYLYETPLPEYDLTYESIVIPHTITAGSPIVSLLYNGERMLYESSAAQELVPGRTYTLNLSFGNAEPATASVRNSTRYLKVTFYEN